MLEQLKDEAQSFEWYLKSAEKGNFSAQYQLSFFDEFVRKHSKDI